MYKIFFITSATNLKDTCLVWNGLTVELFGSEYRTLDSSKLLDYFFLIFFLHINLTFCFLFVFINLTFDFILILLHMRIGTSKLNTSLKWVFTTQSISGLFRDIRVCNYSSKLVSCCRKIKQEIIYTCSCHRYRFIPFRQVYLFLEKATSQTNNKIPETYLPSYYHDSNVIWIGPVRSALN